MIPFDSEDLLSKLVQALALPATRSEPTNDQLYVVLSTAQQRITGILATHAPAVNVIRDSPASQDGGRTYELAFFPIGHLELRDGQNGTLFVPATDWDDTTDGYLLEGKTIRFPNNRIRSFRVGPVARYVPVPATISATDQPTFQPVYGRMAIVYAAAEEFATQGGAMDATPYSVLLQRFLWGDSRMPGDVGLIGQLKTQRYAQGAPSVAVPSTAWWRGNPTWIGGR